MTEVIDLTYNDRAYYDGDVKAICSDALNTNAPNIRLTVTDVHIPGSNRIHITKTDQGWQWNKKVGGIPIILYDRASQSLDRFFPGGAYGLMTSIWLKVDVLP